VTADLTFAAGVLLFTITGVPPSQLMDAQGQLPHQRADIRSIIQAYTDVNGSKLIGFFDRAFQPELMRRYADAADMASDLRAVINSVKAQETAEDMLGQIWAAFSEVTPEQAEDYAEQNNQLLRWAHNLLQHRIGPTLPHNVHVTSMAGRCSEHRSSRMSCWQMGFQVHGANAGVVLPHLIFEVIGKEVVLTGKHGATAEMLLRGPYYDDQSKDKDLEKVERFFLKCLKEFFNKQI
jgi:hypothetical protein